MKRIDHIGIAVKDEMAARKIYESFLDTKVLYEEEVKSQNIKAVFLQVGENKIELLCPLSPESTIAKHIEKRGEGIHHVAFLTEDIYTEIDRLRAEGFKPLSEKPFVGAMNKLVIFFHPKDTNGVLIELCQKQ
jgi:methylmalonyl-CoA/ethylmalonyl-CoA epimerase